MAAGTADCDGPLDPFLSLLQSLPPIFGEIFSAVFMNSTTAVAVAAASAPIALAAVSFPPLPMFPPQGLPQPTASGAPVGGGGGGGTLPASAITNPLLAAEVSSLLSGIEGGVLISVFSSIIAGSFVVDRSVPATAALFAEPDIPPPPLISRQSSSYQTSSKKGSSCPRKRMPMMSSMKDSYITPVVTSPLEHLTSKIKDRISSITSIASSAQSKIYETLHLQCLYPRIMRPFEPIFKYLRCKIGIKEDDFMETPGCNATACMNPEIEDRKIDHELEIPNLDFPMEGQIRTLDDCIANMKKTTYGVRVIAKLVDDVDCDDARYSSICKEVMDENRIIFEDGCETPGCASATDDRYVPCFGCSDNASSKTDQSNDDFEFHFGNRQSDEFYQRTRRSRRLICRQLPAGGIACRLRISRSMELRSRSYLRALSFILREEYLSEDDLNIIRYYLFKKYFFTNYH